ncbi:MAG: GlcNAc-transferase family protein [Burkholderiaceae bacterium]
MERIFVSVAAYSDPMLPFTLASARSQAADPSRLYIGVVEQATPGDGYRPLDEWSHMHVRFTRVPALESRGPCWARALAMALYQGEEWYLQIDSHMWFEPGWDDRLIRWAKRCATTNPRTILTCYPNPFIFRDGHPVAQGVTNRVLASVVRGDCQFAPDNPVLMFEGVGVEVDEPVPGFHVAGGCLFAPGRLVDDVPYDPRFYFHGEEQAFALRAWTHGWDIHHIPGMPLYHLYTQPGTQPRAMHWSPEQDQQRSVRSAQLEALARSRLEALVSDRADLGAYGLGRVRSLADYAAFSGIDYTARSLAPIARKARFGY